MGASYPMRFAEVAVDAPAGYDRTFSYSIPPSLDLRPGQLVQVPFGPRTLQGLVMSLADVPQVPETRDVLSQTGSDPMLTETQLALARWVSRYYMCSLFEAIALMLPPGGRQRPKTYLSGGPAAQTIEPASLPPLQRRVLEYVRGRKTVDQERLIDLFGQRAGSSIARLIDREVLVRTTGRRRSPVTHRYRHFVGLSADRRAAARIWLAEAGHRAPRQAALLDRLSSGDGALGLSDARREYGASAVNAVLAKGWLEKESRLVERDPLSGRTMSASAPVTLTHRQEAVASEIRATLEDPSAARRAVLVQGVTGSGKTEIYLDAVDRCLRLGRKAIVLVPEIALTHQTVERFAGRFPGQVTVLHSGLSTGERFDQWTKTRRGECGVVIGSRGAVFAPQPDLGLIVIDEEHEWTYKQQDASPRYHTRDIALKLSELTGAVVLMGSASPDVTSYYRGLRRELRLLTLPSRVTTRVNGSSQDLGTAPLASVEVVDMRRELREGNRDIFSRALTTALGECLDAGDQVILFLNRRGSASYVQCRGCGLSLRCRRCDVALTFHRVDGRVICHYCGYRRVAPSKCPGCLSYRMSFYGVGTQRVADEVSAQFPAAKVLRWDSDTVTRPGASRELWERFGAGDAQVLVGTQMIAKGLHFPSVTLVGVVSADVGLNIPDYRSGERTFQLLCQVAGRAGRGPSRGRVIFQTYQPDSYPIGAAASQDYQEFYRKEMAFRWEQANPPYGRLIRLLYAHTNRALCEREAARLARLITEQRETSGHSDVDVLGPAPAYPTRLKGHYRWHLVLRGPDPRLLLDRVTVPSGWVVDVDPVTLT